MDGLPQIVITSLAKYFKRNFNG